MGEKKTVVMKKFDFEHANKQTILTVLNPMDDQSSVQGRQNDFEIEDSSTKNRFPTEKFMEKPNLYLRTCQTWLSQLQLEDPSRQFWTQLGL